MRNWYLLQDATTCSSITTKETGSSRTNHASTAPVMIPCSCVSSRSARLPSPLARTARSRNGRISAAPSLLALSVRYVYFYSFFFLFIVGSYIGGKAWKNLPFFTFALRLRSLKRGYDDDSTLTVYWWSWQFSKGTKLNKSVVSFLSSY